MNNAETDNIITSPPESPSDRPKDSSDMAAAVCPVSKAADDSPAGDFSCDGKCRICPCPGAKCHISRGDITLIMIYSGQR